VHKWALHSLFSSQIISKTSNKCIKKISGRVSEGTKPPEDHGVDEKISK
jgi:hypothetical protein